MEQKLAVTDPERVIYSLNVEDLQTVANDELARDLSEEEIRIVEENVADYITWYQAISLAITDMLNKQAQDS
jgi:predicted transcriptional regulator